MSKRGVLLLCLVALVFGALALQLSSGIEQVRPTVAQINGAIAARGACWVAAENKFSTWTADQLKHLLGAYPTDWDEVEGAAINQVPEEQNLAYRTVLALPSAFDWRTSGGVTSVKDQGNCGSCWSFGSVGQLEALYKIYRATTLDLSEQFIVSCETDNYGCNGGYMDRVYNYLKKTGTPDESCFPYRASAVACSNRCSDWASRVKKISSWTWVCRNQPNTTTIKNAVYSNGPVTACFDVYNDFFNYKSGCYQHVTGAYAGGHAVLIVGWTSDGCWIVKNSWGPSWGESGYFKIKFGNCNFGNSSGKFVL